MYVCSCQNHTTTVRNLIKLLEYDVLRLVISLRNRNVKEDTWIIRSAKGMVHTGFTGHTFCKDSRVCGVGQKLVCI